jgi:hypothetical protein
LPFDDIGKTLDELTQTHPALQFSSESIPDAVAECAGEPGIGYSYFFFATQSAPSLETMALEYGGQLRCAGLYATVGVFFPQMKNNQSVADFFSSIDVVDYRFVNDGFNGFDVGWIYFTYKGMSGYIDTAIQF